MTDLLLKPEDTGEIPRRDPGQTTTNLTYITQSPAFRRPDSTFEIPVIEGGFLPGPPGTPPGPDPLPPPPPPTPKVDDRPLSEGEEIVWDSAPVERAYVGLHRRPSHWDWLTVPLSMAVQRIRRSM